MIVGVGLLYLNRDYLLYIACAALYIFHMF